MNTMLPINEMFYSIQGEGFWTGMPAFFIRFAGCNKKCTFCDTDFSQKYGATPPYILTHLQTLNRDCKNVILTGGEPCTHDLKALCDLLHSNGYTIFMETNGSLPLTGKVDWLTVSPKGDDAINVVTHNAEFLPYLQDRELKVVDFLHAMNLDKLKEYFAYYYMQPESNKPESIARCLEFVKNNPEWRLSIQVQKMIGVR